MSAVSLPTETRKSYEAFVYASPPSQTSLLRYLSQPDALRGYTLGLSIDGVFAMWVDIPLKAQWELHVARRMLSCTNHFLLA
jgi:hypothetical protein